LKQKEEMGEALHAIDYDQLQIENKQYLAKIEERNAELLKLKVSSANAIHTLNSYRVLYDFNYRKNYPLFLNILKNSNQTFIRGRNYSQS
jgi:hypothetical protein